jgi:two-component system, LytTR family, response regulator
VPDSAARVRALVVDDEPIARRTLTRLLKSEPGFEVVGESWGAETPGAVRRLRPDLLFLDVQMPGLNGFQVLDELGDEELPVVVFVTAFDEFAVRAFEVRALDYLVKPFTDERFREVVGRVRHELDARRSLAFRSRLSGLLRDEGILAGDDEAAEVGSETGASDDRLLVRTGSRTLVLRHSEIDWVEAVGSYVRVHAGEVHRLVRASLTEMEERLAPAGFARIHRSSLVNLSRVREIEHLSHGDACVRLPDGTSLRVSRGRREDLERALEGEAGSRPAS